VVVHAQQEHRYDGQGLKHRKPPAMAMILVRFLPFLLFFSFGIRSGFFVARRCLHDWRKGRQSFLIYRRSLSSSVEVEG
jgi:hypothetical protein